MSVYSNTTKDFIVHTGLSDTSGHTPLGHSDIREHYIKPIPPMYVTEYESAYTLPPATAYNHPATRHVSDHVADVERTSADKAPSPKSKNNATSNYSVLPNKRHKLTNKCILPKSIKDGETSTDNDNITHNHHISVIIQDIINILNELIRLGKYLYTSVHNYTHTYEYIRCDV